MLSEGLHRNARTVFGLGEPLSVHYVEPELEASIAEDPCWSTIVVGSYARRRRPISVDGWVVEPPSDRE
jgi:hypothetical protein